MKHTLFVFVFKPINIYMQQLLSLMIDFEITLSSMVKFLNK